MEPTDKSETRIKYEEYVGFKFWRVYDEMFRASGAHIETLDNENDRTRNLKRYFGNFMLFVIFVQGWSTVVACQKSLEDEDFAAITNVMAYMSVTLSATSKYLTARNQVKVIYKLGIWVRGVKANRQKGKKVTKIEEFTLLVNKSFFAMAITIALVWTFAPLGRQFKSFIPTKYPFIEASLSDTISFPYVQVPVYIFLSVAVTYTATALLTFIAVFCTEVRALADRFAQVNHDRQNPGQYLKRLKACVDDHNKLLEVMHDINIIHDSIFGFQVFIFIAHFVAFNYSFLVTSSTHAMATLFPMTIISITEFALLCWVGEEISHSLQQFHTSVYMTNWYEAPLKEKKSMAFVLEMLKKRPVLTGAKVFVASLETFVDAARQSFSLYTMMKILTEG